ncbi:unnamed protein product, partial [Ectocarpus sp. 12 AP-2014]
MMTTRHTIIHIIQQYPTPSQGPTQAHTWLGVLPADQRSATASKQEQLLAGSARHCYIQNHSLRTSHHNMTTTHVIYEGEDEEDHSSSKYSSNRWTNHRSPTEMADNVLLARGQATTPDERK